MNRSGTVPRMASRCLVVAMLGFLVAGCETTPAPVGLDLRGAQIVPGSIDPVVDISGLPGGKAVGAGVGAGTGSGAGVVIGAVGCLASGPLYGVCLLAVVPTAAVIGAATGAVVGATKTESLDAMAVKTAAVKTQLGSGAYHAALAQQLQAQLSETSAIDRPTTFGPTASRRIDSGPWTIDVALTEVGTEGKTEFALRLVARLQLRRQGDPTVVYQTASEVQSETELTTAAWVADDAQAIRGVMNVCVQQMAHRLLLDLVPQTSANGRRSPRNKYSTSCEDIPSAWTRTAAS